MEIGAFIALIFLNNVLILTIFIQNRTILEPLAILYTISKKKASRGKPLKALINQYL